MRYSKNLMLLVILSVLLVQCKDLRDVPHRQGNGLKEFGDPKDFCDQYKLARVPLIVDQLFINNMETQPNHGDGEIESLELSNSNQKLTSNQCFLKKKINFINGFVLEFNIDEINGYDNEGFAVVLQGQDEDAVGESGSGLGYDGMTDALAIEFDTLTNYDKHDPDTNYNRHISVIVNSPNIASEIDSIGWNDNPINYNNNYDENYVENAKIRIEYLDRMLRVFINDELQLAIYKNIQLNKIFGRDENEQYIGFTSSTSMNSYGTQKINNIQLRMVQPHIHHIKVIIQDSVLEVKQNIRVVYKVERGCGQPYIPIQSYDSQDDIDIVSDSNCQVVSRFIDYKSEVDNYRMVINCQQAVQKQELKFRFRNKVVDTKVEQIINNQPKFINITRIDEDNDNPIVQLKVVYLDNSKNVCEVDGQNIIQQLQIQNKEGTNQQYKVTEHKKDYLIVSFESSQNGLYKVIDSMLKESGDYEFYVSKQMIGSSSYITIKQKNGDYLSENLLKVGETYTIEQKIYDQNRQVINKQLEYFLQDHNQQIVNHTYYEISFGNIEIKKTGTFYLKNNKNVNCQNCDFQVSNEGLKYEIMKTQLVSSLNDVVSVVDMSRISQFRYMLQFNDIYGNYKKVDFNNVEVELQQQKLCNENVDGLYVITNCNDIKITNGEQKMKVIVDKSGQTEIEFNIINSQFNKNELYISNSRLILRDDIMKVNTKQTLKVQLYDEFNNPALMIPINHIKIESDKRMSVLQSLQAESVYQYQIEFNEEGVHNMKMTIDGEQMIKKVYVINDNQKYKIQFDDRVYKLDEVIHLTLYSESLQSNKKQLDKLTLEYDNHNKVECIKTLNQQYQCHLKVKSTESDIMISMENNQFIEQDYQIDVDSSMFIAMKQDFYIQNKKSKYYVADIIQIRSKKANRIDDLTVRILDRSNQDVKFKIDSQDSIKGYIDIQILSQAVDGAIINLYRKQKIQKCGNCDLLIQPLKIVNWNKCNILLNGQQVNNNSTILIKNKQQPLYLQPHLVDSYNQTLNSSDLKVKLVFNQSTEIHLKSVQGYFYIEMDRLSTMPYTECHLLFVYSNSQRLRIDNIILIGTRSIEDIMYTKDKISQDHIVVRINNEQLTAGEQVYLKVEFRNQFGFMVNTHDRNDHGIVRIKDSSHLEQYQVMRGKLQGSYFIVFIMEKVQKYSIGLQYRNSDGDYVDLKTFNMEVEAERVISRLSVSKTDLESECRVGHQKTIELIAYDRFNNVIQNVEPEKMDLSQNIVQDDVSYSQQKDIIKYQFKCTKIGRLQISSIYMNTIETEVMNSLSDINTQNSQVTTSNTVVQLFDQFDFKIQMRDRFNNNITMDDSDPKLKVQLVNTRNTVEVQDIQVSGQFMKVGVFKLKVKYDMININTDNVRFKVQTKSGDYIKLQYRLSSYSHSDNNDESSNTDESKVDFQMKELSGHDDNIYINNYDRMDIRVYLVDKDGNAMEEDQVKHQFNLSITSGSHRLDLCRFNKQYNQFTICDQSVDKYMQLVNNRQEMKIEIKNGQISKQVKLQVGQISNVGISSGSIEYSRTDIIELQKSKNRLANGIIEYMLVFRDSDGQIVNSRDSQINYKDTFNSRDSDLYQHKVNDGVILVQYRLRKATTRMNQLDLYVGSMSIGSIKVRVHSNQPIDIIQCDRNKQDYTPVQYDVMSNQQTTYFKMRDIYGNEVSNLDYHYLNMKLVGSQQQTQNFKISYQDIGMIKVKMNVRQSGVSTIHVNNKQFNYQMISQTISKKYSYITLDRNTIKAGESISVGMQVNDPFNNVFSLPPLEQLVGYIHTDSDYQIVNNRFKIQYQKVGYHKVEFSIGNVKLESKLVKVTPGDISEKSKLQIFIENMNSFQDLKQNHSIFEYNSLFNPIYYLLPLDQYENVVEVQTTNTELSLQINQEVISFNKMEILANRVMYQLEDSQINEYKNIKYDGIGYIMKLKYDRFDREQKWNVINRYNRVEKEVVSVNNSIIYEDYFKIVVGQTVNIRVSLMTNKNKVYLKDDVSIDTKCSSDQIRNGSQIMDGDDRLIQMTSTRVGQYQVELYVNGHKMYKNVIIDVIVGPLYRLQVTQYQQKLKIDHNNTITVNGSDKYGNRVKLQLTDSIGDQIVQVQNQNHMNIENRLNPVNQSDPYVMVIWTMNSQVGKYSIYSSKYVMDQKQYIVIDMAKMNVIVDRNSIIAGESVVVSIQQQDEQYYEKVDMNQQANQFRYQSIDLNSNQVNKHSQSYSKEVKAQFNISGNNKIQVYYDNQLIVCIDSCIVGVKPGDIWLPNTNVYDEQDTTIHQVIKNQGDQNVRLSYEFYDQYNNEIDQLDIKQKDITIRLDGNQMQSIQFNHKVDNQWLTTYLNQQNSHRFTYLMAATNYTIMIDYKQQQKRMRLDIKGHNKGTDNLPFSKTNSHCLPKQLKLVQCHDTSVIYCDMKSEGNNTYSMPIDKRLLIPENVQKQKVSYHFNVLNGNVFNRFAIVVNWTNECKYKGNNQINIEFNNTLIDQIRVSHEMVGIKKQKKIIYTGLPPRMVSDGKAYIAFALYDEENKKIDNSSFADYLNIQKLEGNGEIQKFNYDDKQKQFNAMIQPQFINYENRLKLVVQFYDLKTQRYTRLSDYQIQTNITQNLFMNHTGVSIQNGKISSDLNYSIHLKDNNQYCYDQDQDGIDLKLKIIGPYILEDKVVDRKVKQVQKLVERKKIQLIQYPSIQKTGKQQCQFVYNGIIRQYQITQSGYYNIQIYHKTKSDKTFKTTYDYIYREFYLGPDVMDVNNTEISIRNLNQSEQSVTYSVEELIYVNLVLKDKYRNVLSDYNHSASLNITNLQEQDYEQQQSIKHDDGLNVQYIEIRLLVKKICQIGRILLKVDDQMVDVESINRNRMPETIDIVAGKVSNRFKDIQIDTSNLNVGKLQTILIQTKDKYNNIISRNTDNLIEISIRGYNLPIVNRDIVPGVVVNNRNGKYSIKYVVGWEGEYILNIKLDNQKYSEFRLKYEFYSCPISRPFRCNDGSCRYHYNECGYKYVLQTMTSMSTKQMIKCSHDQILCSVDSVNRCVDNHQKCDCQVDQKRCGHICIDEDESCYIDDYVELKNQMVNSKNTHLCSDGIKIDRKYNCSSVLVCPPGYKMCQDNLCVQQEQKCQNLTKEQFYNIRDSTYINCRSQVLCPDGTCQPSQFQCQIPKFKCDDSMFQCSDYSCRTHFQDCPSKQICPYGQILCSNYVCSTNCDHQQDQSIQQQSIQQQSIQQQSIQQSIQQQQQQQQYVNNNNNIRLINSSNTNSSSIMIKDINTNSTTNIILSSNNHNHTSSTNMIQSNKVMVNCQNQNDQMDEFHCGTSMTCNTFEYRCGDMSCHKQLIDCIQQTCDDNEYKCWDGRCVESVDRCSTMPSCPDDHPVKCSDGRCTQSQTQCNINAMNINRLKCPIYAPYKCNNGECRKDSSQCSTRISCPSNMPVMCPDSQCVKAKYHCSKIVMMINDSLETYKSEMILCPDGSLANSIAICPSMVTCNPKQIKCWDNSCVDQMSECGLIDNGIRQCPQDRSLRCSDGTCVDNLMNCPSQIICPSDKQIRCSDGNCRSSIEQCSDQTNCPSGMKQCPSGACIQKDKRCAVQITCPSQSSYKCWDQTCASDPRDCPPLKECIDSSQPIQCPNGICVSTRDQCVELFQQMDQCTGKASVRCPDMTCVHNYQMCTDNKKQCPQGFIRCNDNTCRMDISLCPIDICPSYATYKCPNGQCVSDSNLCDNSQNGCPFDRPKRCKNTGKCVSDLSQCPLSQPYQECNTITRRSKPNKTNKDNKPSLPKVSCADGSFRFNKVLCPNEQGCPFDKPLRCATQQCIDGSKQECPIPKCSIEYPIKCSNGMCVSTTSECISELDQLNNDDTNGQHCLSNKEAKIMCADGRCVPFPDMCRPINKCPTGYVRCQDGSCRVIKCQCPQSTNSLCPIEQLPYMCNNGRCSKTKVLCDVQTRSNSTLQQQSLDQFRKQVNQTYIDSLSNIIHYLEFKQNKTNDMSNEFKLMRMQKFKSKFNDIMNNMTNYDNSSDDSSGHRRLQTEQKSKIECKYLCPNGECRDDFLDCPLENTCTIEQPYKCDGSSRCSKYESVVLDKQGCRIQRGCSNKYQCEDGLCVDDIKQCNNLQKCPSTKPHRCSKNHQCVSNESECLSTNDLCIVTKPILCLNGKCVDSQLECVTNTKVYCPINLPYKCSSGLCMKHRYQCDISFQAEQSIQLNHNNHHLQPYKKINNQLCFDNSYRTSIDQCPLFDGCISPSKPYLCLDGSCAKDQTKCQKSSNDYLQTKSQQDECTICEDGICRSKCPKYNGCPKERPLHCSSGFCVKQYIDCAGHDMCPLDSPYRNRDNRCVQNPFNQIKSVRDNKFGKLIVSVFPSVSQKIKFHHDKTNNELIQYLLINHNDGKMPSYNMTIESIPDEMTSQYKMKINTQQYREVIKHFPSIVNLIEQNQVVRSPSFNLTFKANKNIRLNLYSKLDFIEQTDFYQDYCLAKYNHETKELEYVSGPLNKKDNMTNIPDFLFYSLTEPGEYAIIYYPRKIYKEDVLCDVICQNRSSIIWIVIASIIGSILLSIIVYKAIIMFRKLEESKMREKKYQDHLKHIMSLQGSQVVGEGVKDMQLGINFTKNPAYRLQSSESIQHKQTIADLSSTIQQMINHKNSIENEATQLREINASLIDKLKKSSLDQQQYDEQNLNIDPQFME